MLEHRKANQEWNEGARALGFRRPGEPPAPHDPVRARIAFASCVATDPGMADGWLGLHAVGFEPDQALDQMTEHLGRLGEQRRASGRDLKSRFFAGAYFRFELAEWEDVYLAQAARWLGHGRMDLAWGFIHRCSTDRVQRALVVGRLFFYQGDYEAMLPIMQRLSENRVVAPEAKLYIGIGMARRELFGEAERVLAQAAESTDITELAMEAVYFRGLALRSMGRAEDGRQCLEWVYRHNPRYLQVAELLADPNLLGLETRPLAPAARRPVPPEGLDELLAELDRQIGLQEVKDQVRAVAAQVSARKLRAERGLRVVGSSNHLVFAGPPGTGKTTVARLVGRIYAALGVLEGTAFVETSRAGMVGEYVGHTAPKTNAKIDEALDGVLFIDEAYSLNQPGADGGDSYGREAVETLLKRMEDDRERLVVIIAGYRELLERFIDSNPGLRSRFTTTIEFDSYSTEELVAIAARFAERSGDSWAGRSLGLLREAVAEAAGRGWIDELGNGRFVRNLFEGACRQRDLRLFEVTRLGTEQPDNQQLSTIEEGDIAAAITETLAPLRRRNAESAPILRLTERS